MSKHKIFSMMNELILWAKLDDWSTSNDILNNVRTFSNPEDISFFFHSVGRIDLADNGVIQKYLEMGGRFWGITREGSILAGLWCFTGRFALNNPAFIIINQYKKKKVVLNDDTIYFGYINTLKGERGKGYCKQLLRFTMTYYYKKNYKNIIMTTSTDNIGMLKAFESLGGCIVASARIYKLLRMTLKINNFYINYHIHWSLI